MKRSKLTIVIILSVLVILGVMNSFYTLDNAEEAIIERFGQKIAVNNKAGLHFIIPFIDEAIIFKTNEIFSLQYGYRNSTLPSTMEAGSYYDVESEELVLTKHSYLINVGAVIQYRITDPAAYYYNVDDQEGTIRLAFETVLRSNIQNQQLDEALVNKDSIASEILPELAQKLKMYDIGVSVIEVKFTDVLLPEEVQFAYDDVNIATNEKDQYNSKAEKYANEQLPLARAAAYEMTQQAEAYKAEKIATAKGDVENFNQVYQKYSVAKDVTKARLYIETMEEVLKRVQNKYIIDSTDDGVLKMLPINSTLPSQNAGGTNAN